MIGSYVEQRKRKCVLCGRLYRYCPCRCARCGEKIWKKEGDTWVHHVCQGMRR